MRWQDKITNEEVLQMAEKENLSVDVRRRRWKFIGHRTAGLHKPGPRKGNESRADPRQHGEGWWREKEKELQGRTGVRYTLQRQTELQGSRLTFQLNSQVASERFDFTSQNKFLLARLFCTISYCVRRLKILTRGIQRTMCFQGKFPGVMKFTPLFSVLVRS